MAKREAPSTDPEIQALFDTVEPMRSAIVAEARITSGHMANLTAIPHARRLVISPSGSPVICIEGPYEKEDTNRLAQFARRQLMSPATTELDVEFDALLMSFCDVFDRNPFNTQAHLVGEFNHGKEPHDLYLPTDLVVNSQAAVATFIGEVLKLDLEHGGNVFGLEFFQSLLDREREVHAKLTREAVDAAVQRSRYKKIRWRETDEYAISRSVRDSNPEPDNTTFIDSLVARAGTDRDVLDVLLDDCVFARLGIARIPRDLHEPLSVKDKRTGGQIVIYPSEDGKFSISFTRELPQEITTVNFNQVEGNRMTIEQLDDSQGKSSSAPQGFGIKTDAAQLSYEALRKFLFQTSNGTRGMTGAVTASTRQGKAHFEAVHFGEMTVTIPSTDSAREIRIFKSKGDLLINNVGDGNKIVVAGHTGNIEIHHSDGSIQIVSCTGDELHIISCGSKGDPIILKKSGFTNDVSISDGIVRFEALETAKFVATDSSGSVSIVNLDGTDVSVFPDEDSLKVSEFTSTDQ